MIYSSNQFKFSIFQRLKQVNAFTGDFFFFQLMDDKFGNYVLQKLFENSDSKLQNEIFNLVQKSDIYRWKQSKYGFFFCLLKLIFK